ncbi:hypothetical protein L1987_64920 [Smallanthus sonchifolius]|uniref:Uncharacterized protein n=1 Tax=Smallanthus sonchifolius TaxID=185202 RepID=A0ACB9BT21_9ASTR|nr:hypothetical protein L1987_64920 [Smallanthus sonchifolius]
MRNGIKALKNGDGGNQWRFSTVNVVAAASVKKILVEKKKKVDELELGQGNWNSSPGSKLLLKLNYDDVLIAWSDKRSPLPSEVSGSETPCSDIHVSAPF